MNNSINFPTTATATAIVARIFGMTPNQEDWPKNELIYVVQQNAASFSSYESSMLMGRDNMVSAAAQEFSNEIAEIYSALALGQEPLGSEFEAIWDANAIDLYES